MSGKSVHSLSDNEMDPGFWNADGGWYRLFVAYMATYEPIVSLSFAVFPPAPRPFLGPHASPYPATKHPTQMYARATY